MPQLGTIVTAVAVVVAVFLWRIWCMLPRRRHGNSAASPLLGTSPFSGNQTLHGGATAKKIRTLVVLGSGGHTTEMLKLIKRLSVEQYTPLAFVVAASDHTSEEKARMERKGSALQVYTIPRSREVGQSWTSTVFTSMHSLLYSIAVVFHFQPDLLLCNGPGTCIPICVALLLRRFLGLDTTAKLIFCESFARVQRLSLSGRILYHVADAFVVHWPQLQAKYPHATYLGTIC
ncbi:hypothetical protein H310_08396 [Aphanomyces invadans]|uniref:UDP-N-acetylglucosamine transferase subunit ALG14 n=1 Tax=Aphanomyces invadans TaxID=157072 RepID=A0A024TZ72_9STRA|nr:hypothetical protein H310_08396 [Aphanomyces invadans]ETV98906.1 hypothetical protein H310_08396 [Aphanomyces invadans]|eukprot:XP_008872334.1 hypothetical protein H310_08396 [Aphanomyces invadans]